MKVPALPPASRAACAKMSRVLRDRRSLPMMHAPAEKALPAVRTHTHDAWPMLRGIRKASANWLGKLVMALVVGFLVISFAIWGIGDIFRGFGRSTVAKIGATEVTIEQFRRLYNDRL